MQTDLLTLDINTIQEQLSNFLISIINGNIRENIFTAFTIAYK